MNLSPKFKLLSASSSLLDSLSELELVIRGELLIPGLSDDAALHCLLRLSVADHASCKAVCKRWYSIFQSKEHSSNLAIRGSLCLHSTSLLERSTGRFLISPDSLGTPFPQCLLVIYSVPPQGFNCVSIPNEGILYVCGGVISDADCPLNLVMKHQVFKNCWTVMQKMTDGKVYVAGGNGPDLFELGSGEVFDPRKNSWRPIARMCTNMASYDAAVVGGKLLVTEGWFWPFYARPKGQIYDPDKDRWEIMATVLREGWTGSSFVILDHLFVVAEHERTKAESVRWRERLLDNGGRGIVCRRRYEGHTV